MTLGNLFGKLVFLATCCALAACGPIRPLEPEMLWRCGSATCTLHDLAADITLADYRGDVGRLRVLAERARLLAAVNHDSAGWSRYWHGFAWWRAALNAVNDGASAAEAEPMLAAAAEAFETMLRVEPQQVEARIGLLGIMQARMYLYLPPNHVFSQSLARARPLAASLREDAPANLRAAWLIAGMLYRTPEAAGGGKTMAIGYARQKLAIAPEPRASASSVQPTWGRPELLATLAWMLADSAGPSSAARQVADEALALRPDWRYARLTLLPLVTPAVKR